MLFNFFKWCSLTPLNKSGVLPHLSHASRTLSKKEVELFAVVVHTNNSIEKEFRLPVSRRCANRLYIFLSLSRALFGPASAPREDGVTTRTAFYCYHTHTSTSLEKCPRSHRYSIYATASTRSRQLSPFRHDSRVSTQWSSFHSPRDAKCYHAYAACQDVRAHADSSQRAQKSWLQESQRIITIINAVIEISWSRRKGAGDMPGRDVGKDGSPDTPEYARLVSTLQGKWWYSGACRHNGDIPPGKRVA
eukprot:gene10211-7155_t